MSTVYTRTPSLALYNKSEILLYCGTSETNPQIEKLLEEALKEVEGNIQNRVCYTLLDISCENGLLDLGFTKTDSLLLKKLLKDCEKIVLFAATVGIQIDRLIAKYSKISPSKAVMLQAIGAERIEALCDAFEEEIKEEFKTTLPRVSAGYGDIPIEMQRDIFNFLDCFKKIGLTLNESMLMSPTKSVTAIIGIKNTSDIQEK